MHTAEAIIEQAHATAQLAECSPQDVKALWSFAYATWSCADEPKCTYEELLASFDASVGTSDLVSCSQEAP